MRGGAVMRIAVFGTGGIGAIFGSRLLAAGETVHFIARGRHLEALREHGLEITDSDGTRVFEKLSASDDPAGIGPVDIVLLGVKLWDLETAARACAPLIGPETAVVALQNGIDAYATLAGLLGKDHVMVGVAEISATITAPGAVRQTGTFARIRLGEEDGRRSARLQAFGEACLAAGIDFNFSDDIEADRWRKFVMIVSVSALTAVTREPVATVLGDPDIRRVFVGCLEEVVAVGRAKGVALDRGQAERTLGFADALPATMRASMAVDLAEGRRLEVDWLSGRVSRLGRELGVPTPINDTVFAALKPHAAGR
jgi:2-dehydropantoate 2-reductase